MIFASSVVASILFTLGIKLDSTNAFVLNNSQNNIETKIPSCTTNSWMKKDILLPPTSFIVSSNSNIVLSMSEKMSSEEQGDTTTVSIESINEELLGHKKAFDEALNNSEKADEIEKLRVEYLSKKGLVTKSMSYMRILPPTEKPKLGLIINEMKQSMENLIIKRQEELGIAPEAISDEENPTKTKKSPPPPTSDTFEIDISKLDIRVGIIKNAYEHETADKLYCEEIDIGEAQGGIRNIASGIRSYYPSPNDIIGKRVLVLSNLKARKLQGFASHGMILCSSNADGDEIVIVEPPEDSEIGERVSVDGYDGAPASENQVIKKKILDKLLPLKTNENGIVTYNGVPLKTSAGEVQGFLKNADVS